MDEITEHLQSPKKEVERYELSQEQEAKVMNPFCTELDVFSIPDNIRDEFLDLRNDSSARDLFKVKYLYMVISLSCKENKNKIKLRIVHPK